MRVKDVMRTEFVSFQRDDKLLYILQTFSKKKITSAPVFDEKEYIGIVDSKVIVKFFMPKTFLFIWKKDAPVSLEKLRKIIAADMVVKPKTTLNANDNLKSVLNKIVHEVDCIPVFERRKLVGIVRSEDVVNLLLRKFASGYVEPEGKAIPERRRVGTEIDKVYDIVRRYEWISAKEIAEKIGLSVKTVERMGEVLKDHQLVKMKYSFFGGAWLGRVGHERTLKRKHKKEGKK